MLAMPKKKAKGNARAGREREKESSLRIRKERRHKHERGDKWYVLHGVYVYDTISSCVGFTSAHAHAVSSQESGRGHRRSRW